METTELSGALAEQMNYYRARAAEYDQWFLRQGRHNRGVEHCAQWFGEVELVRAQLAELAPFGDTLELAGGTGLWTERLAPGASSLTVVDASAEMLELNRARLGETPVHYIQHDIFSFEPEQRYDFLFFGFWLSHVPSERFDEFWELARRCLKPSGRFFFVDSVKETQSTAVNHVLPLEDDCETLVRKLNDGREFRIFKLFYQPDDLQAKLKSRGWNAFVRQTEHFFLIGSGSIDA